MNCSDYCHLDTLNIIVYFVCPILFLRIVSCDWYINWLGNCFLPIHITPLFAQNMETWNLKNKYNVSGTTS